VRRMLSFGDRVEISVGVRAGRSVSEIAVSIGRDKSVVSRPTPTATSGALAEPAAFGGARSARPLSVTLYGTFAPHPHRLAVAEEAAEDAYSLFHSRSAAMGWLTPAREGATGGLWGMNEGESWAVAGPQPARVGFFQVDVTGRAAGALLPLQPFLSCVGDVMARLGELHLHGLHLQVPERDAEDARLLASRVASRAGLMLEMALSDAINWFAECDPRLRSEVRVTLGAGPDPSIAAEAPGIVGSVKEIRQAIFACTSCSFTKEDRVVLGDGDVDARAPEEAYHGITLHGTLAEWSLDVLGWLAELLTEQASRHGAHGALTLDVDRRTP